jgi:hypothetical protein
MAPPFSLRFLPKKEEKFMVVYLVRSFRTYARIRSLTTGTFNLVVKDRIAVRLSGANSVQANSHKANPTVLETLQTYVQRKTLSTSASHRISTSFPHWERLVGMRARGARLKATIKSLSFRTGKAREESGFLTLTRSSEARSSMAFRFGGKKTPVFRRTPKRKTEN